MSSAGTISEHEARHFVRQTIELLRLPYRIFGANADPEQVSKLTERVMSDPQGLEDEWVTDLLSGAIEREQFDRDSERVSAALKTPRRMFREIEKQLPKGTSGRPRVEASDSELLKLAEFLLPFVRELVRIRGPLTKRGPIETVEYLAHDFPAQSGWVLSRAAQFQNLLTDRQFIAVAKTPEGRAKRIAFTLAGEERGFSRNYALERVRTARPRRILQRIGIY